ncbi:unnamed protein product [Paramecium primaurelia]|uniref:Transmembrane protein n=1 Tax=Paramecium primaurelia TaxID=5886 RepID=A0A8S1N006_PARPR|nr:unnamed protein product [Paramecium primaurelia]
MREYCLQENTLLSNEARLVLKSPKKMSNHQTSLILKTALLGKIVMYIILIVSGIASLFDNLEILWNLLDILQQLSYMKFPENLQIQLEIYKIGSFTPIISYKQIYIYKIYLIVKIPIIPAKWIYQEYEIIVTFFTLSIFGFAYFQFHFASINPCCYFKLQLTCYFLQQQIRKLIQSCQIYFLLIEIGKKQYQQFTYSGLIRILTSYFYELTFASILQIANYNIDTTLNATIHYQHQLHFNQIQSSQYKVNKKLSGLVEGINVEQGSKQYFTILLIKKTLIIVNLVVLQEYAAAQSLITACLSGLFFCYFYIYKPFENTYENMKIFITEILIMLKVILFSGYAILKFNQNKDPAEVLCLINVKWFTLMLVSPCSFRFTNNYQNILIPLCIYILDGQNFDQLSLKVLLTRIQNFKNTNIKSI